MTDQPNTKSFSDGGGIAAQHKVPRTLPIFVAPSVADEFNTVRLSLVAVACWRVNHILFGFDSSFIVPEIQSELRELAKLVKTNPASPASVFGHADPVGDDDLNKALSGRRAKSIFGLLTRNVDLWEDLYIDRHSHDDWGLSSIQAMLSHLQTFDGNPFYSSIVDGSDGPATQSAVRSFQRENNLTVDGAAGPRTRATLFRAYMDSICLAPDDPFVMPPESFLGEGKDPNGKGAFQGCSEFNPVVVFSKKAEDEFRHAEDKTERNAQNAPNRRGMVFLFRPGSKVTPEDWPYPRVNEGTTECRAQFWPDGDLRRRPSTDGREYRNTRNTMACRFYDRFARLSPCEGVILPVLRLRLFDLFGVLIRGAPFRVTAPGLDESGFSVDGNIVIRNVSVPTSVHVQWGRPLDQRTARPPATREDLAIYEYQEDVILDVKSGEESARIGRRLENLGYRALDVEGAIRAFQADCATALTGALEDAEEEIVRRHDRCDPPRDPSA